HAPSLPLLQRPFRQPSAIRNPYQYTYGPPSQGSADSGTNTTTTTLHHHHHHHHHHSNYTLPNASAASNSSATSTTRTGSLRALFSNIFRKSSASSAAHPLSAAAHSAPFLELDGSGGTLQRSSFGGGSSLLGAERHSFTTCYGTKENIYEDIGSQTGLGTVGAESGAAAAARELSVAACVSGSSTAPAGPPPPPPPPLPPSGASSPTAAPLVAVGGQQDSVAAERRRVQVQHDRIIGELNLSVERLIMPSCDDESVQPRDQHASRCQEYSELQDAYDCKQMVIMGQKGSFCRSAVGYDGANVAVAGGMNTSMGGLRLSTKRHFPVPTPAAAAATSSSSPPPTLGAGSERHSPTVSYGKSYGDVDSGISSSSTSGTSYSSSILYRSITNYPQQQQQQQHQQQQQQPAAHHHPPRTKHSLFNLHLGSAGSAGPNRAPCCRGPKDQSIVSRPEGFVGLAGGGSANAVVTNAPDPPPPPDTSLLSYVCPTSDGSYGPIARLPNTSVSSQTLTSCCFLSDHNLAERESASRPFAATFAYNHHHHNNHHHQPQRGSSARASNGGNGSGNFWARFRKLRLPTGSGGKLFSASERHVDTELHLEDFTGESMWPEPGPRPVYHHPLHGGPPPPHHQLALLPLDPHMMPPCALPSTAAPLNGNLPPPPPAASHQRTLH
uniref:Uncharacterized protein n=1 Tax=Anopheles maculatus TaxID=74869 RepID=A0A182SSY4_9DIPT